MDTDSEETGAPALALFDSFSVPVVTTSQINQVPDSLTLFLPSRDCLCIRASSLCLAGKKGTDSPVAPAGAGDGSWPVERISMHEPALEMQEKMMIPLSMIASCSSHFRSSS